MINATTVYWIVMLDSIHLVLFGLAILAGVCIWRVLRYYDERYGEACKIGKERPAFPRIKICLLIVCLICVLIASAFLPTTKQMALIYVVPQIANSEMVQQDIPELYDLGVSALKQQLQEWGKTK